FLIQQTKPEKIFIFFALESCRFLKTFPLAFKRSAKVRKHFKSPNQKQKKTLPFLRQTSALRLKRTQR
ncbi:MAG: hypothetical protein ACFCUI_09235, partial [Bernardetiaceae bacterium]